MVHVADDALVVRLSPTHTRCCWARVGLSLRYTAVGTVARIGHRPQRALGGTGPDDAPADGAGLRGELVRRGNAGMTRRERIRRGRQYVQRSLLLRMRLFALIFLGMLVIMVVDVVRAGWVSVFPVIGAIVVGGVIGMIASRIFALSWDLDARKVVGRIDVAGVVILVLYLVFSIFRSRIVGSFVQGELLGAVSIALLAGVFVGQLVGTARGIARVFRSLIGTTTL